MLPRFLNQLISRPPCGSADCVRKQLELKASLLNERKGIKLPHVPIARVWTTAETPVNGTGFHSSSGLSVAAFSPGRKPGELTRETRTP